MAKIKLTLIGKREWNKHKEDTGEDIHCFFYQGFQKDGKPIEFQSDDGSYEIHKVLKFDDDKAEEFDLEARYDAFKGKMKYKEIQS